MHGTTHCTTTCTAPRTAPQHARHHALHHNMHGTTTLNEEGVIRELSRHPCISCLGKKLRLWESLTVKLSTSVSPSFAYLAKVMSEPVKASSGTRNPRDHSHQSVGGRAPSHHSAASDGHAVTPVDDHQAQSHRSDTGGANGHTHSDLPFDGRIHTYIPDMDEDR
uniref:Uncharacterized protein n=1 Tax=Hucho hucho TaxID=62062 RepID=A0A4W5LGD9_9TELE